MKFNAVINEEASTLKTADIDAFSKTLSASLESAGHSVDIAVCGGDNLVSTLEVAAHDRSAEGLLIAGGDGSVSLSAKLAQKADKLLAVLPAGNMNFFAKSLNMPLDIFEAAKRMSEAKESRADMGFANEHSFVHEFSLGLHPALIEDRDKEKFGSKLGKMIGNVRSAWRLIMTPPRVRVWLDEGNGARPVATPALAVSNNRFGDLPYADRLDEGVLGVYLIKSGNRADVAALAASLQLGGWQDYEFVEVHTAERLRLSRRGKLKAAVDGELVVFKEPVELRIEKAALRVLMFDK